MTPLETMARLHGEVAYLVTAPPADYDPTVEADYVENSDLRKRLIGFTEDRKLLQGAPSGAVAAFTFPAASVPTGLQPMVSRLEWTGISYQVLDWRERRFRGAFDGVTLFLAK